MTPRDVELFEALRQTCSMSLDTNGPSADLTSRCGRRGTVQVVAVQSAQSGRCQSQSRERRRTKW